MSILGNRVLRTEDAKFLTVGGNYVADIVLEGAAHVTYVRSNMAHARLTQLDLAEVRSAPGVIDVVTAEDIDMDWVEPADPMLNQAMMRPWLAQGVVRYVGEPLAAIITEQADQGEDAAQLAFVDYEALPVVIDPLASSSDETLLFPEAGTNVSFACGSSSGDALFEGCDVVVRQRLHNSRVAPCPLEVRAVAARWDADGRLTYWASTQTPHTVRDDLMRYLRLDQEHVRVIAPDVGGGFGAKIGDYPDELLVAWLARRAGRPLRWVETRSESMLSLGHGRAQIQDVEIGGFRDGSIQAYRLTALQDGGAYPRVGSVLPLWTGVMTAGVYQIPKVEFVARTVMTNTTPIGAYRGAGRPEAAAAIERAIDLFAAEIQADPAEVRRRNFIPKDAFPFTTPVGATYDCGDYVAALDRVLEAAGYDELRSEQRRRRQAGGERLLGIGVSTYVEITGGTLQGDYGSVEVQPDGRAVVSTGTSPHGQGHVTSWAMLVSDQLGIPFDDVSVQHGDTALVPRGVGTYGSRSLQTGGIAAREAAALLVERARQLAADEFEVEPSDVVFDKAGGRFHVAGMPSAGRTWAQLAVAAGRHGGLRAESDSKPSAATFPFGAHVAVVEVDSATGKVTLKRMVAVDDAGRIINPLIAEGQVHGGLAQGVAQALMEEVRYDESGNLKTSNLADYAFISAAELPSFEAIIQETPTPVNELGVKGIGESATIGSTPAVLNAVIDAMAHLGVRHMDMPTTPERVWRAILETKGAGRHQRPVTPRGLLATS
ncbi:xanthine dehydrogenase family protein molybdopterin-binding subunit [bacterium]|nr:MAG: xanthine dehydrogenase family protein molybdopterin-binding subunit [bacterium]